MPGTGPDERTGWRTVAAAAEALGVSESTVRRRIAAGTLEAEREYHGRSYRWLVLLPADLVEAPAAMPDEPPVPDEPAAADEPTVSVTVAPASSVAPAAVPPVTPVASTPLARTVERIEPVEARLPSPSPPLADPPLPPPGADAPAGRTVRDRRLALVLSVTVLFLALGLSLMPLATWVGGAARALAIVAVLVLGSEVAALVRMHRRRDDERLSQ